MDSFLKQLSRALFTNFETSVQQLLTSSGRFHKARVCACCDCFLDCDENGIVSLQSLIKMSSKCKGDPGVPQELRRYYTVPNLPELDELLLSPRSTFLLNLDGLLYCTECLSSIKGSHLPRFAIANNKTIGEAPQCLENLNPVELALISKSRIAKHVFQYYGGAHESIEGWHTFYQADVNQLSNVLNRLGMAGVGNSIATILVGPFTTSQRLKVNKESILRRNWVRTALQWLSDNNIHYNDVNVDGNIDDSVINIDTSGPDQPSQCSCVEMNYEYTGE